MCKLDLEKAYDHGNWDFLLYMLRRCGFRGKWCSWISHCISLVRFFVLVNGTPNGFFSSLWGLRHGDPRSPMVFVIVMEALGRMISATVNEGLLFGFSMGTENGGGIAIPHLLFADDTLIFCKADSNHLRHLQYFDFSYSFEVVSGLKVNLAKLELVPVGNVDDVDGLACWKRMSCPSFFSLWVLQTVLRSFSMNSYGVS